MASNPPSIAPVFEDPSRRGSDDINVKDVIDLLIRQRVLIATCALLGLLAAILYSTFWPKSYEAVVTLKVVDVLDRPIDPNAVADKTVQSLDLIHNPKFAGLDASKIKARLLKIVQMRNESGIVTIRVCERDPQLAADLANAWAFGSIQSVLDSKRDLDQIEYNALHTRVENMKKEMKNGGGAEPREVTDFRYALLLHQQEMNLIRTGESGLVMTSKAVVPEKPVQLQMSKALSLGLIFGSLAGVFIGFVLEKIQNRIKNESDVEIVTGSFPLAVIPGLKSGNGTNKLLPAEPPSSRQLIADPQFNETPLRDSFNFFSVNLDAVLAGKEAKTISVLPLVRGDSASLINANLALSLSRLGKKVLLIDANLRKPTLHLLFGVAVPSESGLAKASSGEKKADMIIESGFENLSLLPNSTCPSDPDLLLGSKGFKQLVQELKKHYDHIVFDGVSINPFADSVVLSSVLDGVILMVVRNKTSLGELEEALRRLKGVHASVLGTVLSEIGGGTKN